MAKQNIEDVVAADMDRRDVRKKEEPKGKQEKASHNLEKVVTLRLELDVHTRLEEHFHREKGLRLSQGLRMLIAEYMRRERV